jgi:coenzyme F420-0:L-glutamate ligase / coenzyme F420-1:gamma-L-glutamate ligase
VRIWPLPVLPEIKSGDRLDRIIAEASDGVLTGDVLCVAQKVVSKAEGRTIELAAVKPGSKARELAETTGKDPALCELILAESARIVRIRRSLVICETHHGLVCANAGIDASNVAAGHVVLLPKDPDASARRIQAAVSEKVGGRVGVVVTDTHGRAFRKGLVNVAIGVAGFRPVIDHRGEHDREGRTLVATDQAIADELAAASGIYMQKASGTPVVCCSGATTLPAPGALSDLVRDAEQDLFRG